MDQDVARLDIAVDHALSMRIAECLGDVGGDVDSISDRKLLLTVQPVLQRVAFHVGHHIEEKTFRFAGVV